MKEQITLIIGAGANKEINPQIGLGSELLQGISDRVTDRTSVEKRYLSELLQKLEISDSQKASFVSLLDAYKNAVPYPSIDGFINEINTFPEFKEYKDAFKTIGYSSIIFHIMGYEGSETVQNINNDINAKKTWLSLICDYIERQDILSDKPKIELNIITFNYDRILEGYILKRFSKVSAEFIDKHIHHVYGRIGCLEGLAQREISDSIIEETISLNFGNDQIHQIVQLRNNIKLMYDERNDTKTIKDIVQKSTKILIMGYGFDDLNNTRIGLNNLKDQTLHAAIYSSFWGDFNYRRNFATKVRSLYSETIFHYQTCYDFIKEVLI
jgi:hypothetical protein